MNHYKTNNSIGCWFDMAKFPFIATNSIAIVFISTVIKMVRWHCNGLNRFCECSFRSNTSLYGISQHIVALCLFCPAIVHSIQTVWSSQSKYAFTKHNLRSQQQYPENIQTRQYTSASVRIFWSPWHKIILHIIFLNHFFWLEIAFTSPFGPVHVTI